MGATERRQQKLQQWLCPTRSSSTWMLTERMLTKPLTSSVPPVLVSHGQFAPLSSIQDFSSSVVSNQITVIFKWFPFYLKNFLFLSPELVLWEKCLHKEGLSSKRFLHTHHPQIRKNSRNKMIKKNHTEGDGISWLQQNRNFVLCLCSCQHCQPRQLLTQMLQGSLLVVQACPALAGRLSNDGRDRKEAKACSEPTASTDSSFCPRKSSACN